MTSEKTAKSTAARRWMQRAMGVMTALVISILALLFWAMWTRPEGVFFPYNGTVDYETEAWTLEKDGEVMEEDFALPIYQDFKVGSVYKLSTRLDYDGEVDKAPYAFITLNHMGVRVRLDGEELYYCNQESMDKQDRAKSIGNLYVEVPLGADCLGKELEIEIYPALELGGKYQLGPVYFGDYGSMMHALFSHDLFRNMVSILTILLGLVVIFFSLVTGYGENYRQGVYIGLFALVFSIYRVTESEFNLRMFANPYVLYLMNIFTFILVPVLIVLFYREKLEGWGRGFCTSLIHLGIINFIVQSVLHFSGIMDLREMLSCTHLYYIASIIGIFVLILCWKESGKRKKLLYEMIPLILGFSLDAVSYYFKLDVSYGNADYMAIAIVIWMLIEAVGVWNYSVAVYKNSVRSGYFREMAYQDVLTTTGNRRAYEDEVEQVRSGEKSYENLIVVSADINDLKKVNDLQGHLFGDELIRGAAAVLKDLAGEEGLVFRSGGDEFFVFLYDLSLERVEQRLQNLCTNIKRHNETSPVCLGLALGYAEIQDRNIDSGIRAAEKQMYRDKARQKAGRCTITKN